MRIQEIITEKWSQKYKSSINCNNPKGFSQRAHCQGRKKESIAEGYKLRLERDPNMYVLHIVDTATGKRTEVRGKSGYETNGYDATDRLHQLLDRIGKTANVSELINGEVVTINPKHPDADKAKSATDKAYNEETGDEMLSIFQQMHHDAGNNAEMDRFIKSHDWELRNFTPDMFPSEEEFFDYDDPFNRVIDIDYNHRVDLSQPIIVGPQFKDGKYSVIDGNHRAAAAQAAGKTIKGYFPIIKENFADGKVKGKSRPGRVKRSGASCNGSVSDLRARAKKYGGERGRMYHWCANMKSGRKKK